MEKQKEQATIKEIIEVLSNLILKASIKKDNREDD